MNQSFGLVVPRSQSRRREETVRHVSWRRSVRRFVVLRRLQGRRREDIGLDANAGSRGITSPIG